MHGPLQAGLLFHQLQDLADRGIVPGEDIAAARLSPLGAGHDPLCHIPDIHKVIAAAHREGQLSREKGRQHMGDAAFPGIPGADDAGGKDQAGRQPVSDRVYDEARRHRLALCVMPAHKGSGYAGPLGHHQSRRRFRDRVDRAHIDELPYVMQKALAQDIAGPLNIHPVQVLPGLGRDRNDPRAVDHDGFRV